jgi:hypothetical protein
MTTTIENLNGLSWTHTAHPDQMMRFLIAQIRKLKSSIP